MAKIALADCSGVDNAVIATAPLYNSPRGRAPSLWALPWEGFDLTQIKQFRLPPLSRLMTADLSLLATADEVIE